MKIIGMVNKVHCNIQVIGKVQGVWFRKYTKDKADMLGLTGIVKNKTDGNVYIEAEGEKEIVEGFIRWLYEGSPQSNVVEVIYETSKFIGFESFEIL